MITSTVTLILELFSGGFVLKLDGDALRVSQASRLTDAQRAAIREQKAAILATLRKREVASDVTPPACTAPLDPTDLGERAAILAEPGGLEPADAVETAAAELTGGSHAQFVTDTITPACRQTAPTLHLRADQPARR